MFLVSNPCNPKTSCIYTQCYQLTNFGDYLRTNKSWVLAASLLFILFLAIFIYDNWINNINPSSVHTMDRSPNVNEFNEMKTEPQVQYLQLFTIFLYFLFCSLYLLAFLHLFFCCRIILLQLRNFQIMTSHPILAYQRILSNPHRKWLAIMWLVSCEHSWDQI